MLRVSKLERICKSAEYESKVAISAYPVHLSPLFVITRAGEGDLVHGSKRDRIRVVSAQDERVGVARLKRQLCPSF
jgi:hypothetical protein